MWRLVPALVQQMGAAYPELVRAQPLITETLKLEETRFKQTLERGLSCSTRRSRGSSDEGRHAERRGRVQALRHLRLPARPDAGRPARPRHRRSTSTASTARWRQQRERRARPGPARARRRPKRSGSTCASELGATEFLGYRPKTAEGEVMALVVDGKPSRSRQGRRRGRADRQPDAVLRRVRRPDGRHRRHDHRRRARRSGQRHAEEARRPVRPSRQGRPRAR